MVACRSTLVILARYSSPLLTPFSWASMASSALASVLKKRLFLLPRASRPKSTCQRGLPRIRTCAFLGILLLPSVAASAAVCCRHNWATSGAQLDHNSGAPFFYRAKKFPKTCRKHAIWPDFPKKKMVGAVRFELTTF